MSEPIFTTRRLDFAYGDVVALSGVDLEVPAGRIGLVGANGAGKTTLLRLLLGILPSAAGTVEVFGRPVPADAYAVRARTGYMPETACLPLDQTAADFVTYSAELAGVPGKQARQRASEVLGLVGLAEERFRYLGEYSTGMRQKAKLAQAIVHGPDLVLLDEPTAGLDPEGRDEFLALIARLGGFDMSVVISSHVLSDIERTCQWVVMLDGGRVLRNGPLAALGNDRVVRIEVLGDPAPVVAGLTSFGARVEVHGPVVEASSDAEDPFILVRDVLAETGTAIRSLGPKTTTLEDVFLAQEEPASADLKEWPV